MTWFLALAPLVRRLMVGAILFCLLAVVVVTLSYCHERRRAEEADAGRAMADARSASAGDASDIRDRADERAQKIDDTVKGATDAVRSAPDRDSRNRAALLGLCRVNPDASPDCRVLLARP